MKFPRQFSLRALLILLTICALVSAAVWQFWPRYRTYLERMRFEAAAKELKPGTTVVEVWQKLGVGRWTSYGPDSQGRTVGLIPYFFRDAYYCVYVEFDLGPEDRGLSSVPSSTLEVYRLPLPPPDYTAQSAGAKEILASWSANSLLSRTQDDDDPQRAALLKAEDDRRSAYILDFREMITGRAGDDLGIHYERISTDQAEGG